MRINTGNVLQNVRGTEYDCVSELSNILHITSLDISQ